MATQEIAIQKSTAGEVTVAEVIAEVESATTEIVSPTVLDSESWRFQILSTELARMGLRAGAYMYASSIDTVAPYAQAEKSAKQEKIARELIDAYRGLEFHINILEAHLSPDQSKEPQPAGLLVVC